MRFIIFLFALSLLPWPARAAEAISGDTMRLEDGRSIRLAGIEAAGRDAKNALQTLIDAGGLRLQELGTDRYGRRSAELYAGTKGEPLWLQGEMLKRGLAFVYPPEGSEPRLDEMLRLERDARQAKRGIWADPAYADRPAGDPAAIGYGQFAFVSGKVLKAARVKNMLYLNFGPDWTTDFTVAIAAHDLHKFKKAGIDPLDYADRTLRVRGWVASDHGPMITVTDPSQIELLGEAAVRP